MPLNVPYGSQESQEDPTSAPLTEPLPTPVPVGAFSVPLNGGPKVKKGFKMKMYQTFGR